MATLTQPVQERHLERDIGYESTPSHAVNILLASFAGLGLPRTLSLPVDSSSPVCDVVQIVSDRLPSANHRLIITTTNNKQLLLSNHAPISTLLSSPCDTFLPLRLSIRLCGGKGGFGSQLRAAGGRMSSRKKGPNAQQNANGSNRNLDGRRLRTVEEAKRLADYLAIKPEMDKKEKEERKKRWEAVVEAADKREEEIKSGKAGANQGRLDAEYVEGKEAAEEKTREAVLKAMREGILLERTGSESSDDASNAESQDVDVGEGSSGSASAEEDTKAEPRQSRTFFGWDDDEEENDSEEDADDDAGGEMRAKEQRQT